MTEATPEGRSARVRQHALEVGFDLVGIAPPDAGEAYDRYVDAMGRGFGAHMDWLHGNPEVREDVRAVHASSRAVVVLGVNYWTDSPGYLDQPPDRDRGWIARYAQGKDYHVHVRRMLIRLVKRFEADDLLGYRSVEHRIFVDTGPVLEKAFAQRAGIGWIGKNTLLINRERGSWYFLAVVLTPLDLAFDAAETDHCGTCTRCLEICPTDAFAAPYVLDARRCIATWTIETDEPADVIDPDALGQHVFGCDLCQEVCPWNAKAVPTPHAPLRPRPDNVRPTLASLGDLDQEGFRARFPRSAVTRVDARRMGQVIGSIQGRAKKA